MQFNESSLWQSQMVHNDHMNKEEKKKTTTKVNCIAKMKRQMNLPLGSQNRRKAAVSTTL